MSLFYGSCVEWLGSGLLITGKSGSGKSDLSFRLLENGANLIADDQVELKSENGVLTASAPQSLQGLIEVRGIGILKTPFKETTQIKLKIELCPLEEIERLPKPQTEVLLGVEIPVLKLSPFCLSSLLKIKTFLSVINGEKELVL